MTVGAYSPLQIGNSRTVPAVLTGYLQSSPVICGLRQLPVGPANYLQGPPVTHRARPSSGVTRQIAPSETPAVPPVRPGHPFRYRRPSRPDSKTDGLDAWEHWHRVVRALLERDNVNLRISDNDGRTAVSLAAGQGNRLVLKLLLERRDAHPDKPDKSGKTPLEWAEESGHGTLVTMLLEHEDVNRSFVFGGLML